MNVQELRSIYKAEITQTQNAIDTLKWESRPVYQEWLAQTYFYIVHSTRIIALAGALFPLEKHALHLRFMDHVKEEKGHERVILLDLKTLGQRIQDYSPTGSSLALYQTQYYWIQNVAPLSVYGYFLFLEGLSIECGPAVYRRLEGTYPDNAIRHFKLHVEEDVDHVRHHFEMLENASPLEIEQIAKNLKQTASLYRSMISEIACKENAVEMAA